jgi:hypothetical protein
MIVFARVNWMPELSKSAVALKAASSADLLDIEMIYLLA